MFDQDLGTGANILVPLAVTGLLTAPVTTLVGFMAAIVIVATDHWSATRAAQLHTTLQPRGNGPGSTGGAAPPALRHTAVRGTPPALSTAANLYVGYF